MGRTARHGSVAAALIAVVLLAAAVVPIDDAAAQETVPGADATAEEAGESSEGIVGVTTITLAGDPPPPTMSLFAHEEAGDDPSQDLFDEPQSTIEITYDACEDGEPPPEAKVVIDHVVDLWEHLIASSIPINVSMGWCSLGDEPQAPLGTASTAYTTAFDNTTYYHLALARRLAGSNLHPGFATTTIRLNSDRPDWYFGVDENPPGGEFDLASVVSHEIGHGVGFAGIMRVDIVGGVDHGLWRIGEGEQKEECGRPSIFDRFTEGQGQALLDYQCDSTELADALTSGDVWFKGEEVLSVTDGVGARLYAPATWTGGSSYSHLDSDTYNPTVHSLMTPTIGRGEARHHPGPITLCLYQDLGWDTPRNCAFVDGAPWVSAFDLDPPRVNVGQDEATVEVTMTIVADPGLEEDPQVTFLDPASGPELGPVTWTDVDSNGSEHHFTGEVVVPQGSTDGDWDVAVGALEDTEGRANPDPALPEGAPTFLEVRHVGPPDPPTNVIATPGHEEATVTWDPPDKDGSSEITHYTVTASPGGAQEQVNHPETEATITGLTNGTEYTFTVVATNAEGDSEPAQSNAVTPGEPPGKPTNVEAAAGNEQATVTWDPPDNEGTSPILDYTVTSNPDGIQGTVAHPETEATLTGLTNGTEYTFTVTARNATGDSDPSDPSNAVTPIGPPDPPTNVNATPGNEEATVAWDPPDNDGGSEILTYAVTTSPDHADPEVVAHPETEATITGLTNGTEYTFTVVATNAEGDSDPAQSDAVTPGEPPGKPTNVEAVAGNQQATVTWDAPEDEGTSAIIDYTVTSDPDGIQATVAHPEAEATVEGLTKGTQYTFTVTARNATGDSDSSDPSNTVTPFGPPDPPSEVFAASGNQQATVTWEPPDDDGGSAITGYTVVTSPGDDETPVDPAETDATITGLTNGETYTFRVRAHNDHGAGELSDPSEPVTPAGPPGKPTGVKAVSGDKQATVTWVTPDDNGGIEILDYTITASPGGASETVNHPGTKATLIGLTNGQTYTFTVTARNAVDVSDPAQSNAVTPAGPPFAPTGVTAERGDQQATVSWNPANNNGSPVTHYTVTTSPTDVEEVVVTQTQTTINGLTNGSSYTFRVRAHNNVGSSSLSSASNSVTPAGVPGAPGTPVAEAGDGEAMVSWTPAQANGATVASYTVTAEPGGATAVVSGSATSATVAGLANDTAHTFAVRATNSVGQGPASDPSEPVTPFASGVFRWAGRDRFTTAAHISAETFDPGVPIAYVATGHNFPDALAGGAAGGHTGGPVLLTTTTALPQPTRDELQRLQPGEIRLLGGTGAIAPSVEQQLNRIAPTTRIAGPDRFTTAAHISADTFPNADTVFIATGHNFPDALAGGAAGGHTAAPILLVPTATPDVVLDELTRLGTRRAIILGGASAVSSTVEQQLHAHLGS